VSVKTKKKNVRRRFKRRGTHPLQKYLREGRLPHIWCPGCGLGSALNCLCQAFSDEGFGLDELAVVSGIGCSGRAAGYLATDSYHTTHGRAIPFATGLKLAQPELNVTVFSGDGDLFGIGGNHFIHAARRNIDLTVICINNYNFGMTGGQFGPTTPQGANSTTSPYGNRERPFNLPALASSAGAVYVARWTTLHVRALKEAIGEALRKDGFSFVEVLSPCPTSYGRRNEMGDGREELRYYREKSVIKDGADPREAAIESENQEEIVLGKFLDEEERPSYPRVAKASLGS